MWPAFVWTSTKNEWNEQNAIWSRAFGPSITRNLITLVLTISHVKLKQSTVILTFDRQVSLALRNLWLLLVVSLFCSATEELLELFCKGWSKSQKKKEKKRKKINEGGGGEDKRREVSFSPLLPQVSFSLSFQLSRRTGTETLAS